MALRNSQQALKQLQTLRKSKPSAKGLLSDAEQRLGVGQVRNNVQNYRGTVANTERLLDQVDPSVTGRTAGTFTTEAQRSALVRKERQPIGEELVTQRQSLSDESANLSELAQRAFQEAQLGQAEYEDRYSSLQGIYDTLYKREQDKLALEEARKARAGAGIGSYFGGLGGDPGGDAKGDQTAAFKQQKNGGFAFTVGGQPVSAAMYASAVNKPLRSVLALMAQRGDKGAAEALKFVGNDFKYDPSKVTEPWQVDLYNSLVWGSGLENKDFKPPQPSFWDNIFKRPGGEQKKTGVASLSPGYSGFR